MNSTQLQKEHDDVYQHFFATNQIVLSTPYILNWAGDVSPSYCGVNIKQKIPLRMYIGLKPCASKGFFPEKITYYDTYQNKFIHFELLTICPQRKPLLDLCQKYAEETTRADVGYEISLLCELPQDAGLGFDQIFCLLLGSAVMKVCGRYNFALSENARATPYTQRANYNSQEEGDLFTFVGELERELVGSYLHTGVGLSSYFDGSQPYVTYHVTNESGINEYHINRLDELIPEFDDAALRRIQYGVIYSGKPVVLKDIFNAKNHNAGYFEEVKNLMNTMFGDITHSTTPGFMTHCSVNQCTEVSSYMAAYASTSLELLYTFWLCRRSYIDEKTKQFVYAVNKIRFASNVLRKPSSYLSTLIDILYSHLPKPKLLGFNYNDTSLAGGSLVFAMNGDNNYRYLTKAVEKAHEQLHEAEILYYNIYDGVEKKGLYMDQDLSGGVVHQSIQSGDFCIVSNDGNRIYGLYDELKNHKDVDLLLDSVTMKLRVNGEKPSSKDVHSQAACVELMSLLVQRNGSVKNSEMSKNSYTKSINEMRGKIIYPLIEFIRKTTGKMLNLEASGAMNEFIVTLGASDLKIGIVLRVEHL